MEGAIAQLVEQRTENPCVPGSIPGGTTKRKLKNFLFFCLYPQSVSVYIANQNSRYSFCRAVALYG